MPIATNPQTGEAVYLDDSGAWKPAQIAVNPQTKERLAFDGKQWAPLKAQESQRSKGALGYVDDVGRSLASGATFGYADELAAKMNEVTGLGGSYEENVAKERARDEQIPSAIAIPGQIAGGVASTLLGGPALLAAKGVRAGVAALPNLVKFGGLGAIEGGLSGSGNATEGNRLSGAATGAAIGAPVGAAAPYVVRGIGNTVNAVRGAVSPEANVAADLGRAISRDADEPAALLARTQAMQADRGGVATLADAGGENVKGLVERVAQTPGAGRTQVVPALTQRQQGQAHRIGHDLKSLTGTSKSAVETINETMADRAAKAKPLYDEAMGVDIAQNQQVVDAIMGETSTGWGRAILNSTNVKRTLQTEYGVTDTPGPQHLMPIIDAWKKAADDMVESATRSGDKNKARVISQMRDRVLSVVDEANPAYAKARDAWAGPSKYMDAVERGRGILKPSESAEEFAARFKALPDAEKEAERIGAVSSIIGRMGGDSAKLGDMTKYLRSPEVRAKIAAIMPDDDAAAAWQRRLDFEVGSSELTGRALGNSATARRLAERQDAENLMGDLVMDALQGSPQSFVRKVLGAGPKWLRDTMRSRADALLADVLTNPTKAGQLPRILQRAQSLSAPVSDQANSAAVAGGAALLAP
jgi:hypothetical protein